MNKDSPTLPNPHNPVDNPHLAVDESSSLPTPGQPSPHPSLTHPVDEPQTQTQTQQAFPPPNQTQQQIPSVVEQTPTTATSVSTSTSNTNPASSAAASAAASAAVAAAAATDERALQNQKLVEEFQYLLEKSQSLFSGLRHAVSLLFSTLLLLTRFSASIKGSASHRKPPTMETGNPPSILLAS